VPADIIESRFGKNFKIEEGKVVAYGHDGNKLFSKSRPGEPAEFEEALELLVDGYAHKDQILKGTGNSGTNKDPSKNPPNGGPDLSKLSPTARMDAARASAAR
jgi:hypothetical protein